MHMSALTGFIFFRYEDGIDANGTDREQGQDARRQALSEKALAYMTERATL